MSATLIENEDEPPTLLSLPNLAIELILEMTIDSINNVGEALRTLGSLLSTCTALRTIALDIRLPTRLARRLGIHPAFPGEILKAEMSCNAPIRSSPGPSPAGPETLDPNVQRRMFLFALDRLSASTHGLKSFTGPLARVLKELDEWLAREDKAIDQARKDEISEFVAAIRDQIECCQDLRPVYRVVLILYQVDESAPLGMDQGSIDALYRTIVAGSNHMSWTSLRELIEELASLVPDPSSPTTGNGNGTAAADPSLDGDEVDLFPALACHLRSLSDTAAETVRQLQDVRSAVAEAYGAAQAACSAAPHADVHAAPLSAAVTEGQSAAAVATACGQEQEFRFWTRPRSVSQATSSDSSDSDDVVELPCPNEPHQTFRVM